MSVELNATPALPQIDAAADPARGVDFVLRVFGATTVVAHHPDMGPRGGIWLDESTKDRVIRWIEERNRAGCNIYFHPNQPRHGLNKKANKGDIEFIRTVWADLDCYKNGQTMTSAWALNTALPLKPTVVIASGGGLHPYFRFHEGELATPERVARAQALGQRIIDRTGGGDPVANIDRIMRFPFTTNYPNAKKREVGRTACPSGVVIGEEGPRYTLGELEAAFPPTNVVHFPGGPDRPKTSVPVNTPIAGTPPAIMTKRGAAAAAQQAAAVPSLNAAAQTHMQWFGKLSPENQNTALRAIAALPEIIAMPDTAKLAGYLNMLFAFADAAHRGATEAYEIARQWAQTSPTRYNDVDFDRDWHSFKPGKPGGITVATLLDAAKNVGFDTQPWRDLANGAAAVVGDEAHTAPSVSLDDFYAYMPMHNYIFAPSRAMWPVASVNSRIRPIKLKDANGQPVLDGNGKQVALAASAWLDQFKPVEQMTWAPGLPIVIRDKLILDGGWIARRGIQCFNLYQPPIIEDGDPTQAGKWLDHLRYIYPDDAEHILDWLAHRVQRPQEKINHSLVLGGKAGIGKDTVLEPVKYAVGAWNFQEVTPQKILDKYSGYLKSVILRINEARDLGEFDRFQFYEHTKIYMASPPDVLPVNEKHIREYVITNVCGIIITTNHKTDGIYLPADDRRHYVAWSDRTKEDPRFQGNYWNDMWNYYEGGGKQHVAAYLRQRDISKFDPKAPPPKSAAFWAIVNSGRSSEDAELADALDVLGNPDAVTLSAVTDHLLGKSAAKGQARIPGAPISSMSSQDAAKLEFAFWLRDRKNRRVIPHRFEACGYVPVRNPDAKDGQWKIGDHRHTVYAKEDLQLREQINAARRLTSLTSLIGSVRSV